MENHLDGEPPIRLDALKLIDIRLLSQSELLALSLCSTPPSSSSASASLAAGKDDDLLTPKIDRSVFNESAGSRKQTFSRLRLARHHSSPEPPSSRSCPNENFEEENAQILPLFKSLFFVDSGIANAVEEEKKNVGIGDETEQDQKLLPVPVRYMNELEANSDWETEKSVLVQVEYSTEIKRKRGRPRKNPNPRNWVTESENNRAEVVGIAELDTIKDIDAQDLIRRAQRGHAIDPPESINAQKDSSRIAFGSETKRKRGRPRKIKNQSDIGTQGEGDENRGVVGALPAAPNPLWENQG